MEFLKNVPYASVKILLHKKGIATDASNIIFISGHRDAPNDFAAAIGSFPSNEINTEALVSFFIN